MNDRVLTLTPPEAGLLLTAQISFSDDILTEGEAVAVRKYYNAETVRSTESKLEQAGFTYPDDINQLEPAIMESLKTTESSQKMRALSAALEVAHADGIFDREEMLILSRYCEACGLSMAEVDQYRLKQLAELDERGDYSLAPDPLPYHPPITLTSPEAGLALAALTAFSDDNLTDGEAGIIREFYTIENLTSLDKKMEEGGYSYPEDLPLLKESILEALVGLDRIYRLKYMSIAYKTAMADGVIDRDELYILKQFCEEFVIGLGELEKFPI